MIVPLGCSPKMWKSHEMGSRTLLWKKNVYDIYIYIYIVTHIYMGILTCILAYTDIDMHIHIYIHIHIHIHYTLYIIHYTLYIIHYIRQDTLFTSFRFCRRLNPFNFRPLYANPLVRANCNFPYKCSPFRSS